MNIRVIIRAVSAIIMVVGVIMVTAAPVSHWMGDPGEIQIKLLESALIPLAVSLLGIFLVPKSGKIRYREGIAIVTFSWLFASIFGAIPFIWVCHLSKVDAFFETMSGFTTTGASILADIEVQPKGILYWRSMTHWLGGMGIVVLSLAIMPILGIGGMQLYKAEAPGPTSDQLTPRIANTAKILWGVYLLLSLAETAFLMLPIGGKGMSLFEAWCHTCGTVATGGFSTRNTSVASFHSAYIEWVIIIFMFLSGTNFVLHLRALRGKPFAFWRDEEFRFYFYIILFSVATIGAGLYVKFGYGPLTTIRHAAFSVVSVVTTTGFCTEDFDLWPAYARLVLIGLMFMGGCGGSTAGAMKASRVLLLLKYARVQLRRCLFPRSVVNVRLDDNRVNDGIMSRVLGFFFMYVGIFFVMTLLICAVEPKLATPVYGDATHNMSMRSVETAISSVATTLGGVGPGLAKVGPTRNYAWCSIPTKLILSFAMLIGRLEIFTMLALFLPEFWR